MAFYLVRLLDTCQASGCLRQATYEVRSSGTVSYGCFCKRHAEQKKKLLEKAPR
ncbi:hypothetical protein LCGC14_0252500 [marine sediment metagenome]|uniref:Uncharacterized protein n=1 Tax=marine sediment metagenome TaxID=412755 RepID=A0A0F9X980_9ZZZZ